jgi:hypothetical protein
MARLIVAPSCAIALLAGACDQRLSPPAPQASGFRGAQTLTLEVDPLTLDFPATLTATGAVPGDEVVFVLGDALGAGPCPSVLGGLCLGVTAPAVVGRAIADTDGVGRLTLSLDAGLGIRDVALQAVVVDGADSSTSAAVARSTVACTHVPAQHATLQDAIDAALDGDHLCVAAGTYAERIDLSGRSLVLLGEDASTTVIDGGGPSPTDLTPVLEVSGTDDATRVSRFTVTGGHNAEGAGVRADTSDALLTDLVITGNTCDVPYASSPPECQGTGLYTWAGRLTLRDVAVRENRCDITTPFGWRCQGTGVYAELGAPRLERVEVSGNIQNAHDSDGAGLYLLGADAALVQVEVSGNAQVGSNSAGLEGAGLFVTGDGDVAFTGGSVRDNLQTCTSTGSLSCYVGGTGVLLDDAGGSFALSDVDIVDNVADAVSALGVGLHASYSAGIDLADVTISGNQADGVGAMRGIGVYLWHAGLTAERTVVSGNTARHTGTIGAAGEALEGVGLYLGEATTVALSNTVIADNRGEILGGVASCRGGGVYTDGALTVTNGIVAGNACAHGGGGASGGGLFLDLYEAEVALYNVDVVGNTAQGTLGEGIHVSDGTALTVVNSSISDPVHAWIFSTTTLDARHSNFWGPVSGWTSPAGADGNIAVDPGYTDTSGPDALGWNLRLTPSSVLVDAGDPALADPDGSRSDIGAHGGPDADLPL